MTIKIAGTGSCPGEEIVSNDRLAEIMDTSDEWIRTRTGIRSRRLAVNMGTSDMAAEAAKLACENAGITPEELDLIILATSTPDDCFPNGACQVQAAIGAVNAVGFDISAACTGFIFAMTTAYSFLMTGMYQTALVIGADTMSKAVDWNDRGTCVLFGDGAGAAVVKAGEQGLFHSVIGSDGTRGPVLTCTARTNGSFLNGKKPELGMVHMDGQEVFKFAIKKVPESIKELMEKAGAKPEEIRYYILHQANERIIESVAKRLKEPMEKFPMNIQETGNTSGASIPLLLDKLNRDGMLKTGDKVILAGFGAGLTWGAILLEL